MVMDLEKQDLVMQFGGKNNFIVAIWMVTYNHEKFIEQAIESVMSQETNFDFKLFIGEDCSTDNTCKICEKLNQKYPEKIELHLHEKNVGANKNALQIYKQCFESGAKYVAMLEGDDYWTDPHKLQKQVDFLEANPDYVLSFHKVKILKPDGSLVPDFITKVPEHYENQEALARLGNYIHTPSVLFRNVIEELPKEFLLSPIGDYFLYMLLAEHGKLKYLEDEMAVYRYGVGVISKMNNFMIASNNVKMYSCMIGTIKDLDVKSILMKRQEMIIEQYGNSFEVKTIDNYKFSEIITYLKKKILKIIFNPKKKV